MPIPPLTSGSRRRHPAALPPLFVAAVGAVLLVAGRVHAQSFYSHGEPTADEQFELELINAARANPAATGAALATTADPFLKQGYAQFGIDPNVLRAQFAAYAARPPLAFHPALINAARAHTADMVANHYSGHVGSDGSTDQSRAQAAGYSIYVAENAGGTRSYPSYEASVLGGYLVDWGVASLGHRTNILDLRTNYVGATEIGIGTGPFFCDTQLFGYYPAGGAPTYLTGVAYQDRNGNGRYDQGEGLPGVTVTVDGNSTYTVTSASGGYALPLSGRGALQAHAFGGALGDGQARSFSTGGENVKWDLVLAADGGAGAPPGAAAPAEVALGLQGKVLVLDRGGDLSAELPVTVVLAGAASGRRTLLFAAGESQLRVSLKTFAKKGKLTITLVEGEGYTLGSVAVIKTKF